MLVTLCQRCLWCKLLDKHAISQHRIANTFAGIENLQPDNPTLSIKVHRHAIRNLSPYLLPVRRATRYRARQPLHHR